nr:YbaB/EbfC family nucleoid-associated protein [Haloechinothrix aidingensis]
MLGEYRRNRERLAAKQRELAEIRASAGARDGTVTATVGPRGTLVDLHISQEAYHRYRPEELAAEILRATAAARDDALSRAADALDEVLPAGYDPQALLHGATGLSGADAPVSAERYGRAAFRPDAAVRPSGRRVTEEAGEDEEDFEHRDWVTGGRRGPR